jgi:heat shock protein HslJ
MNQDSWARFGLLAIAVVGFFAILGIALGSSGGLEGEEWVVEELARDGNLIAPVPGTELTALFENGALGGNAGCNSFFADYTVDGDSIAIGPAGSTMAFCTAPEGIMEQEVTYLALLGAADSYSRDGDRLTLNSAGSPVINYRLAD